MLADRRGIALAAEIARERLFADHMLAARHRLHDHLGMQMGRRADIDDVDVAVGDELGKAAIGGRNPVPMGKFEDVLAARGHRANLDIDAVDTPERIHMQLRDEAAADHPHPDFCHC
jgi:hypothetical protein